MLSHQFIHKPPQYSLVVGFCALTLKKWLQINEATQGPVGALKVIWANQPIYSFLVGCLNPCLQETSVRVGLPQPFEGST